MNIGVCWINGRICTKTHFNNFIFRARHSHVSGLDSKDDVLDEETVETMWATIVDKDNGLYKLDSIPFYAPLVASDDIVFAEFDENEQMLTYRETVEYSGNSTIQIVLMDKSKDINQIREKDGSTQTT